MTDSQRLLAEYARSGSDAAFGELVSRYLDLVYSTALRLVGGDTHQAEDVAQTTFVDLARLARTLPPEVMPGGWLHRHTCFVAAKAMRGERRRQSRERQAVEMNALQADSDPSLTLIAPILDEAINELGETDRAAILLRFFEQHDFRAVGELLGSSEDAARMRVTRALEKLQSLLKHRGVTTSVASLSVMLAANAVQAAPAGLALTISTAAALAGTTMATTATAAAINTLAMTTLQKTIIGATLAIAVGTGIYQARQAANLREQNQALEQQQAALTDRIEQLLRERDDATNRLASSVSQNGTSHSNPSELLRLRGEVTRLRADSQDPAGIAARALLAKVDRLKQQLRERPGAAIPELRFLTEGDWLTIANRPLDTDDDCRRALAALRNAGEEKFRSRLAPALRRFQEANNGQFPADIVQLQSFFDSPVEDALLQRWQVVPAQTVPNVQLGGDWIITQRTPVDEDFDTRMVIGPNSYGSTSFQDAGRALRPVAKAFAAANGGRAPTDLSQLLPYATTPEQQAALQKLIRRRNSAAR